jgi:uncharacterized protein YkwD
MARIQVNGRVLMMLAVGALAVSFGAEPARGSDAATGFGSGLERETFALVNQYRKANDLPALVWDDAIAAEARGHSRDMATGEVDFGHDGFSGRVDRLKDAMSGLRGAGENVLMTDNPDQVARSAVALWLRSPHHLKNIRGDYNYSGLGVWEDKGGTIYFTQIFVKVERAAGESPGATTAATSAPMPGGGLETLRMPNTP